MLCRSQVNIKWVFLALLCETLAQNKVLGLHNTVVRQPTDTSLRKIHAGRVGEERESGLPFTAQTLHSLA